MPPRLTLISHKLCPYVQRAVIALTEKDVAFERVDIDRFGPWTMKAGVLHVQPPAEIMSHILAIRLHLEGIFRFDFSPKICRSLEKQRGGAQTNSARRG